MSWHRHSSRRAHDLIARFAPQEEAFLEQSFLAPALPGGVIHVRLGGVVCRIRIVPEEFRGWGVFSAVSHSEAILEREATLAERLGYLGLFPTVRLIVCRRRGHDWFGSAASLGDARIHIDGIPPILLAEEVQLFDFVRCRYDGARFWFDQADNRHDPAVAAYLRASLSAQVAPEDLARKGLTAEERAAYELNYWEQLAAAEAEADRQPESHHPRRQRRAARPAPPAHDPLRARLEGSLSHAGADLIDYLERGDGIRVRYRVQGHEYISSVNRNDLSVQLAGICLSGQDHKFDLSSLVGVLHEGMRHREF